ncbi:hypothetical protein EDB85DRAFT_2164076 [Lactarius pseudohatsudake]|nr:hypothetical protein EDB85DRAFT_2164076 [Lactarius pseudohatsudake]
MFALAAGHSDRHRIDRAINELHDVSVKAELHRYRSYVQEAERLEQRLHHLVQALGETKGEVACSKFRLEMADVMDRIDKKQMAQQHVSDNRNEDHDCDRDTWVVAATMTAMMEQWQGWRWHRQWGQGQWWGMAAGIARAAMAMQTVVTRTDVDDDEDADNHNTDVDGGTEGDDADAGGGADGGDREYLGVVLMCIFQKLAGGAGMKADVFMRTPNTLFYSDKALFDEALFPRCPKDNSRREPRGVTQLDETVPDELSKDDTTPGDDDNLPPEPPIKKGRSAPQPAAGPPLSSHTRGIGLLLPPPLPPHPVPGPSEPRRSGRIRKPVTHPDNVYGDRPPTTIIRDIARTHTWRQLTQPQQGSSQQRPRPEQMASGDNPDPADSDSSSAQSDNLHDSDEVDQQLLIRLAQEGGVKFLDLLLAKAVSPLDLESPDTSNIREWTYRDILNMPSEPQEEWHNACKEELASLRKRSVYDLVNPPKGRRVIKNRWVFDLKSHGRKKARLVANSVRHG